MLPQFLHHLLRNSMKTFYVTTTLPYVNAAPHLGFAVELVQADVLARVHALRGEEVFFNVGTDEHGLKIYRQAVAVGQTPQEYVDAYAAKFSALRTALNVQWTAFTRTTDPHHRTAAQAFWERCAAAGDIYKSSYVVQYCVGCELEKTDSELVDGMCPIHPTTPLEQIAEENYFFRFSAYQQRLLDLYQRYPDFVVPQFRLEEMRSFVATGLKDFSISRRADKMPWGIPVPGDADHVMYVWFDALINYISTLGWPEDAERLARYWGTADAPRAVQLAGKDNLRQQAAMWQAMLLSANLPPTRQIFIHGFVTSAGQKMSKSVGNVIDPYEVVRRYGTDAVRYFILAAMHPYDDSDFTFERFVEFYNAHLANNLGNLASRVLKMASRLDLRHAGPSAPAFWQEAADETLVRIGAHLEQFAYHEVMQRIAERVQALNVRIEQEQPFKLPPEAARPIVAALLADLDVIACLIVPLLPNAAAAIREAVAAGVELPAPLFPRVSL